MVDGPMRQKYWGGGGHEGNRIIEIEIACSDSIKEKSALESEEEPKRKSR